MGEDDDANELGKASEEAEYREKRERERRIQERDEDECGEGKGGWLGPSPKFPARTLTLGPDSLKSIFQRQTGAVRAHTWISERIPVFRSIPTSWNHNDHSSLPAPWIWVRFLFFF